MNTGRKLLLFLVFALPGGCMAQSWHEARLPVQAFVRDLEILHEHLESLHGDMYRYSAASDLERLLAELKDAPSMLSYRDAHYRMARYIDAIKDGHTWIMPAEKHAWEMLKEANFLPFTIRVQGNVMVVNELFLPVPGMQSGDHILAIDQLPVREIVKELLPYFPADGYSLPGKLAALEDQFWWHYGLHFGFKPVREVQLQGRDGQVRYVHVKTDRVTDRFQDVDDVYTRSKPGRDPVQLEMHGDRAVLAVRDFHSQSLWKYKRDFLKALRHCRQASVEALVIDLRGNGGGREGVENLLLSAIGSSCKDKYDTVCIKAPRAHTYRYIDQAGRRYLEDLLYRLVEFRQDEEGNWLRRPRFERTFKPMKEAFTGPVCLLSDRHVFSGASEFLALAREVPGVLIVGEESCGGYQGHTSGYSYDLVLPNTGFELHIPRIRFDLNVEGNYDGGVLPHVQLSQGSNAFDKLLRFALEEDWPAKMEQLRLGGDRHLEVARD